MGMFVCFLTPPTVPPSGHDFPSLLYKRHVLVRVAVSQVHLQTLLHSQVLFPSLGAELSISVAWAAYC